MEFNNKILQQLCEKYIITLEHASPGHHETMGLVERCNKTLFGKLIKLCNYNSDCWEEQLQKAVYATNISYNKVLLTSPYTFKFGKIPILNIDKENNEKEITLCRSALVNNRDMNFDDYAKKNIQKGKISANNDFVIGEHVLIYKEQSNSKFASKWSEGYIITGKINEDSYIVSNGLQTLRLNKIHLKKDKSVKKKEERMVS